MIIPKWTFIAFFAFYFILMGLIGNGCSGSGITPTSPAQINQDSINGQSGNQNSFQYPSTLTSVLPDGGKTGIGVMGIYSITFDPKNITADITLERSASAVGDSFVVDITNFLSITPCADCLKLAGISQNESGNFIFRFSIRHPFKAGNLGSPPSSTNRLDLHIFDVYGELYVPGEVTEFPISQKSIATKITLVNADGYTDQFDTQIDETFSTMASLHAYKVMSLDPTNGNYDPNSVSGFTNIIAPTGQNVLPMGGSPQYSDFEMAFNTTGQVSFAIVVTAAYGQSATKDTRLVPKYYLPEFHRKEAWKVEYEITENTLFDNLTNTSCSLKIKVWDWNHNSAVDPSMAAKNAIKAESKVAVVGIEIPGVSINPVMASGPSSGDGVLTPLVYSATISNTAASSFGLKHGLIEVIDSRLPNQNTGGLGDAVARNGITFFNLTEFATYQTFTVEVHKPEPIPIISSVPYPPVVYPMEEITFDGSQSYDYDGSIMTYEWDFDYNGTTFNVDATGAYPAPVAYDNNRNNDDLTHTVALRVTDNNSTPYTVIGTVEVTVLPNRPPIANFVMSVDPPVIRRGTTVNFIASGSSDPDGDTLTYEWDFDFEPGNFTVDATGASTSHVYNMMGVYRIALKAYDQGIPSPKSGITSQLLTVIPKFEPSLKIDTSMTWREAPRDTNSTTIVVDPNTNDVYLAYCGYTTGKYLRIQRSSDGGQTWGTPTIPNNAGNANGDWGYAICAVPDHIPAYIYVFWISEGGNSSSVTGDSNNIRFNFGIPGPGNTMDWQQLSWNQDITLFNLSTAAKYGTAYYQYSDPTDLCVINDPVSVGTVYLAYIEENTTVGRSVRLLRSTDIIAYPASNWIPMTATSHVDSATLRDFDSVDMAFDSSNNLYVTYDDNSESRIEIRKYPYGQAPGNASQVVASDADYTRLYFPRIAVDKQGNPVVAYTNTNTPGAPLGIANICMNYGIDDLPTMSEPIVVNSSSSMSFNHLAPEIAVDKDSGMIFVVYEDRRDNASNGEIYWTIFDNSYSRLLEDERVNTSDPTYTLADFDMHVALKSNANGVNIVATWEEATEDTMVGRAF